MAMAMTAATGSQRFRDPETVVMLFPNKNAVVKITAHKDTKRQGLAAQSARPWRVPPMTWRKRVRCLTTGIHSRLVKTLVKTRPYSEKA